MNDIERVSQFWDSARARVLEIAEAAGLDISLEEHDDEFLFDLFGRQVRNFAADVDFHSGNY